MRAAGTPPMQTPGGAARRQRGFSLIEMMVSIVIGFAVIGALLAAYLASVQSGRNTQAGIQMTEDASIALNLMRAQLAMAGYSEPTGIGAGTAFARAYKGSAIFGCNGGSGFGTTAQNLIDSGLACTGTDGTNPDSLALAYQVQVTTVGGKNYANGVVSAANKPYDCIGNEIVADAAGYFIADSHYYLATPAGAAHSALYCRQGALLPGAAAGQPVAENIVDFQVKYLMGAAPRDAQATYFSDAPAPLAGVLAWKAVIAVRLCVEVVSTTPMTDANVNYSYVDCTNTPKTAADGALHRTFTTTVTLQNR